MSVEFSRAQMLRQHRRHEEAVSLLTAHLAHHPEDAHAFIELALNRMEIPGAKQLALQDARQACGLMPSEAFPLALQSRILSSLDRESEALPLAEAAIAADAEDTSGWIAKALALMGLKRWREAEEAVRTTLALDPDDETASNCLAHILRMQNRLDESEEETRRRLARDPENAFSFANAGWAALQRGQRTEAEAHFKEALRLNPEMEHAREGLKNAYRARSGFYRVFLKWAFFLQRFTSRHQFAILIGIVFGFRIVRAIAAAVHPLLVLPILLIYYIFIFGSWLAGAVANLLILKDPVARLSLDPAEKVEGVVVGGSFLGGLITVVIGLILENAAVAIGGAIFMMAAIPLSLVFTNPSTRGRMVFGTAAAAIFGLGGLGWTKIIGLPLTEVMKGSSGAAFSIALLVAMAVTWLGSVPSLRQAKPT